MVLYYLAKYVLLTYTILKLSLLRLKLLAEDQGESLPCIRNELVREERVASAVVWRRLFPAVICE